MIFLHLEPFVVVDQRVSFVFTLLVDRKLFPVIYICRVGLYGFLLVVLPTEDWIAHGQYTRGGLANVIRTDSAQYRGLQPSSA